MARVVLVNVHGDNFGDFLNAVAAELFAREWLDAQITASVSAPIPWGTLPFDCRKDIDSVRLGASRASNLDAALHLGRVPHGCWNSVIWARLEGALADADIVVTPPSGANIGPYRQGAFLFPFITRDSPPSRVLLFGTVHPSGSRLFDGMALRALSGANIAVRDQLSLEYLQGRGQKAHGPADLSSIAAARMASSSSRRRDVLSVVLGERLAWHPVDDVSRGDHGVSIRSAILQESVSVAAEYSLRVEVAPHSPLQSELADLSAIISALNDTRVDVALRRDVKMAEDYVAVLASSRAVVSFRYHGCLVSLATATPLVAIAYEEKSRHLMRALRLADHCMDVGSFDRDELRRKLTRVVLRSTLEHDSWRRARDELLEGVANDASTFASRIM